MRQKNTHFKIFHLFYPCILKILFICLSLQLSSCGIARYLIGRGLDRIDIESLEDPAVSTSDLRDLFPELESEKYGISDMQGKKIQYIPPFYKYCFSYKANIDEISKFIADIKCTNFNEIEPDNELVKISFSDLKNLNKDLSDEDRKEFSFFFDYLENPPENLEFYQCVKTPVIHYLVLDREEGIIYHMIESFRE